MLQGVISPSVVTTPTIGRAIASLSSPIARMKARWATRSSPSVVMRERSLRFARPPDSGGAEAFGPSGMAGLPVCGALP